METGDAGAQQQNTAAGGAGAGRDRQRGQCSGEAFQQTSAVHGYSLALNSDAGSSMAGGSQNEPVEKFFSTGRDPVLVVDRGFCD